VPTLADRGCHVVSATSPSDRNFDFLDPEILASKEGKEEQYYTQVVNKLKINRLKVKLVF
jgi:hypothetical protein